MKNRNITEKDGYKTMDTLKNNRLKRFMEVTFKRLCLSDNAEIVKYA